MLRRKKNNEEHNWRMSNHLLTYPMEQSTSLEANRFAASQEIPSILWNPNVHYRIHKCTPPVPMHTNFCALRIMELRYFSIVFRKV
jgi:hypothetical protein